MTTQTSSAEFWRAVRDILPMAAGVATYGLAFGLLAAKAGMNELQVGTMGGLVFAGASQIVAVERLIAGAGAAAALIAAIALNLRLLLITASIRDVFVGRPWWQLLIGAHLSSDENWARGLNALPGCLIVALVANLVFSGGPNEWIAGALSLATALLTRNLLMTMAVGIATIVVARLYLF